MLSAFPFFLALTFYVRYTEGKEAGFNDIMLSP